VDCGVLQRELVLLGKGGSALPSRAAHSIGAVGSEELRSKSAKALRGICWVHRRSSWRKKKKAAV
jgi:hypothetical protein